MTKALLIARLVVANKPASYFPITIEYANALEHSQIPMN